MQEIKHTAVTHPVFGNCIKLENGLIELLVTLEFGPRIIHFSISGKENMFYEDEEKKTLGEKFLIYEGDQFRLYGGHRLWIAPEIMPRCYCPDNLPVTYEETENGGKFTAPAEKVVAVEKSMVIEMDKDKPMVTIHHFIKNCSQLDLASAPWAITMLAKGGTAVIPMPKGKKDFLPSKTISLWDYSKMNDPRVYWWQDYIVLSQKENTEPFKLGLNNDEGWAAYFGRKQLFIKFFDYVEGGLYSDNGCSYEAYTNKDFLESESLGQLDLLKPEGVATHVEKWVLYEEDPLGFGINEDEVRSRLEPYIQ